MRRCPVCEERTVGFRLLFGATFDRKTIRCRGCYSRLRAEEGSPLLISLLGLPLVFLLVAGAIWISIAADSVALLLLLGSAAFAVPWFLAEMVFSSLKDIDGQRGRR